MSDETETIPKAEFDRRLSAWKAQEATLKQQLADANKKVTELQPMADRASAAEAKLAEIEAGAARDAVFAEAGVTDARARAILLAQYNADLASLGQGETLELKDFLGKASEDPYLSAIVKPQGQQAQGQQGAQGKRASVTTPAGVAQPPAQQAAARDYAKEMAELRAKNDIAGARKVQAEWRDHLGQTGGLDTSRVPG